MMTGSTSWRKHHVHSSSSPWILVDAAPVTLNRRALVVRNSYVYEIQYDIIYVTLNRQTLWLWRAVKATVAAIMSITTINRKALNRK